MGKICLVAVWLSSPRCLLGSLILLLTLGLSASAASNHATAVLHVQVTVVPTVQIAPNQPSATSPTGAVTYNLEAPTAPKMTSEVTIQPMSNQSKVSSNPKDSTKSGNGAVLQTRTIVAE